MRLNARTVLRAGGAVAVLGLTAFAGVYLTLFNPKPVAKVSLPTSPAASPTGVAGGTWSVGAGSFVGYRVREQLADLPAPSDAVGRTGVVSGGATSVVNADGTATVSPLTVK